MGTPIGTRGHGAKSAPLPTLHLRCRRQEAALLTRPARRGFLKGSGRRASRRNPTRRAACRTKGWGQKESKKTKGSLAALVQGGLSIKARPGGKRARYLFGIAGNHLKIRSRRLVGLTSSLLPIAQGAERNVIARGKFLLRECESAAQAFDARHTARRAPLLRRHRSRVGVGRRRRRNLCFGHWLHRPFRERPLAAVVQYLDHSAVRSNSRGSRYLVHVVLPVGLR